MFLLQYSSLEWSTMEVLTNTLLIFTHLWDYPLDLYLHRDSVIAHWDDRFTISFEVEVPLSFLKRSEETGGSPFHYVRKQLRCSHSQLGFSGLSYSWANRSCCRRKCRQQPFSALSFIDRLVSRFLTATCSLTTLLDIQTPLLPQRPSPVLIFSVIKWKACFWKGGPGLQALIMDAAAGQAIEWVYVKAVAGVWVRAHVSSNELLPAESVNREKGVKSFNRPVVMWGHELEDWR